jgi:hypothetical protein
LGDLVIAKVLAENLKKKGARGKARGTRKTAENSWLIPDPPTRSLIRFRGHEGSSRVLRFKDGCDTAFQSKPDPTIGNSELPCTPKDVPTPVQGCGDNDNSGTFVQAESQKVIRPAGGGLQCLMTASAYVRECRLAELLNVASQAAHLATDKGAG